MNFPPRPNSSFLDVAMAATTTFSITQPSTSTLKPNLAPTPSNGLKIHTQVTLYFNGFPGDKSIGTVPFCQHPTAITDIHWWPSHYQCSAVAGTESAALSLQQKLLTSSPKLLKLPYQWILVTLMTEFLESSAPGISEWAFYYWKGSLMCRAEWAHTKNEITKLRLGNLSVNAPDSKQLSLTILGSVIKEHSVMEPSSTNMQKCSDRQAYLYYLQPHLGKVNSRTSWVLFVIV